MLLTEHLQTLKVLDLFSGIGGFSIGLESSGMETIAFCEIDQFCRKVLAQRWPDIPIHEDITELNGSKYAQSVDVICGGFPCQDLSFAGNQAGIEAERSGLWSQYCRIIGEVRPQYAIIENVTALISGDDGRWFSRVLGDLASIGFDAEWHCIPAFYVGAPHIRDRVWIIAYPSGQHENTPLVGQIVQDRQIHGQLRGMGRSSWSGWDADQCPLVGVVDGVQDWSHRVKALGNSVVWQVVEQIGLAIIEREKAQ